MCQFKAILCSSILTVISGTALADQIKIASWNIEWLTKNHTGTIKRSDPDFSTLNSYFRKLDADVVAVQEIDSRAALTAVTPPNYKIILSDRSHPQFSHHQFSDVNQYTGFAIHNSVPFSDPQDIDLYGKGHHKLRFASYVILYPKSQTPIHTLSIHLKAGCMGKFNPTKESCQTLLEQGRQLNIWISEREKHHQQYIVMGDFNHNLSYSGDWLWKTLSEGIKKKPILATRNTAADCKIRKRHSANQLHQFRSIIDHIVVSPELSSSDTKQMIYKPQDVFSYQLSDHCPVSSLLSW